MKRLDYGKKYCHSPTIEESALQAAIVNAIQKVAAADGEKIQTLKSHIDKVFTENITTDNEEEMSLQIRISELDGEIKAMISSVSADTIDDFDEEKAQSLMSEKNELQNKLEELYGNKTRKEAVQSRLQDVYAIMDGLKNHQIVYNDELVRQIIEVVIVESKEKIKMIFNAKLINTYNLLCMNQGSTAAAIRFAEGNELYVSVRGENSIFAFDVKAQTLQLRERFSCNGNSPRDFNIVDDFIVCANENSDNIVVFQKYDLTVTDTICLKSPVCITIAN